MVGPSGEEGRGIHSRKRTMNRNKKREANTPSVAEWLRAWDTLTMFEATVCGRS